jgi:hypothetical protein
MSNLLDKASIILTPTAYNNGEALCVKPSDGSGDFDFSRNSAATRVNAQGLVENVQILSSNLVQNGDFSEEGAEEVSNGSFSQEGVQQISNGSFDTDTKWTTNTGWSISGGSANCDGTQSGNTSLVQQNGIKGAIIDFVVGKTYKVNFDIVVTSGNITNIEVASGNDGGNVTTSGNHTTYITAVSTNDRFTITANPDFIGSIDNVSVREVGQDWTLGTGWSIGEDKAVLTNVGYNINCTQANVTTIGKYYKIEFTILDYISGQIRISLGGSATSLVSANGTYVFYLQATINNVLVLQPLSASGTNLSITNISVKEVGQNWSLGSGVSIGSNEAVFTSTPSGQSVGQNAVAAALPNGALAKVSFEVLTRTEGTFGIYFSGTLVGTLASAGVFTGYFTKGTETSFYIRALGTTSGTISNINVIQITDDTNLPRINYEDFSYQDVLGSELVVNGGFDSDTAWSKGAGWSIANGEATHTGGASYLSQSILNADTQYKVKIKVSQASGSNFVQIYMGGSPASVLIQNVGEYEYIFTSQTSIGLGFALRGAGNVTIDNVSVKEYLGQEVVPDSGCGSWLFESQSTNLITQSELFSDASWVKIGASVTSNAVISPEGILNADKLVEDSTNGYHILDTENMGSKSGSYTYSLFAKKGENNFVVLWWVYASTSKTWFDLENGVVGSQTGAATDNAKIEDYGNGWFKCSVTRNEIGNVYCVIGNSNQDAVFSYQGDGTSGVYIWGAQLEQQSYATSYIPTEGSTVTRNQDLCTNGGSLASINSTSGTLYFEGSALDWGASANNQISLSDGSGSNRIMIYPYSENQLGLRFNANASQLVSQTITVSILSVNFKIAIRWGNGNYSIYQNGLEAYTQSISSTPLGLSKLNFSSATGGSNFYGKTKALAVWKEALSDSELQSLTTI